MGKPLTTEEKIDMILSEQVAIKELLEEIVEKLNEFGMDISDFTSRSDN